jgi:hypothetical protein
MKLFEFNMADFSRNIAPVQPSLHKTVDGDFPLRVSHDDVAYVVRIRCRTLSLAVVE